MKASWSQRRFSCRCCSPLRSLVIFTGFPKPENAFPIPIPFWIAIQFQLILIAETNLVYHIIESFDYMERIDTDFYIGKFLSCNRDKAVSLVTAEVFHPLALFRRKLAEVLIDSAAGDLVQDIY